MQTCIVGLVLVEINSRPSCHERKGVRVSRPQGGYLSSSLHFELHGAGSRHCPWVIEVNPGQKVNITLINFGASPANVQVYLIVSCMHGKFFKRERDTYITIILTLTNPQSGPTSKQTLALLHNYLILNFLWQLASHALALILLFHIISL